MIKNYFRIFFIRNKICKSEYSLYDIKNFDDEGNVITTNNKTDFIILLGSN